MYFFFFLFYLSIATCIDNCLICDGDDVDSLVCIQCEDTFYLDSICIPCPSNCIQCLNNNTCTQCDDDFGFVVDEETGYITCEQCDDGCLECMRGKCLECAEGYIINEDMICEKEETYNVTTVIIIIGSVSVVSLIIIVVNLWICYELDVIKKKKINEFSNAKDESIWSLIKQKLSSKGKDSSPKLEDNLKPATLEQTQTLDYLELQPVSKDPSSLATVVFRNKKSSVESSDIVQHEDLDSSNDSLDQMTPKDIDSE
ncbi:hypothetical protein QTN25_000878 [Entamoeba marina]